MKILILHTKYQLRGGEDAVVEHEVELLRQHHLVEIIYFNNRPGWRGALQFLVSIWNTSDAKKVKEQIRKFKPDVVHIHNWHFASGPLVFRVINNLAIPIVHTVHNYRLLCPSGILLNKNQLFTDSLKQSFPWQAIRKKVYRSSLSQTFWLGFIVWFHKKIGTWKKIDTFVCLTPFAVDLFQQSNFGVAAELFVVKPNFTALPEIVQSMQRGNHFLFIGRLTEEKGIATLLQAFSELPLLLRIAGDGPLKKRVVAAANEFANITYIGNLSYEEVVLELHQSQALIFPSIWYEGMPMTILESLSASTPIIASNLGAMTSIIIDGYNGFHFEPGTVENLKEVVCQFETLSVIEKKQMGINAFENYKSNYSVGLQLGYLEAIYSKVLKN